MTLHSHVPSSAPFQETTDFLEVGNMPSSCHSQNTCYYVHNTYMLSTYLINHYLLVRDIITLTISQKVIQYPLRLNLRDKLFFHESSKC